MQKKENNQPQLIKSFLYLSKYKLLLEEDVENKAYEMLVSEIKNAVFPTKNILESILAKNLENYLDQNAYKLRNRTTTDTIISSDYRTWDIKTLYQQVHMHYQNSLKQSEKLSTIKDTEFSEVLVYGDNDQKYRNTIYDLLANRALRFYNTTPSYSKKISNFTIESSHFETPFFFVQIPLKDHSGFSAIKTALALHQKLEKMHLVKKDTLSLVATALERLALLREKSTEDSLYPKALKKLYTEFNNGVVNASIALKLACYYQENMNLVTHPTYNTKALELCQQIIAQYPSTPIGIEAKKLQTFITNPDLKIITEKFIVPNKPSRAFIEYKDMDTIHLSFYKIPFNYQSIQDSYYSIDSLITDFTKNRTPAKKITYSLPKNNYHLKRSTEVILPKLKSGKYLILVQKDPNIEFQDNIYGINYLQVTSLALVPFSTNQKSSYQVVDRLHGFPIKKAIIKLQDPRNESTYFRKLRTDENGKASILLEKKAHQLSTLVYKDGDSLFVETFNNQFYKSYDNSNEEENHLAKGTIFTDRSIYRPGQKVYFKGVLTQLKKNKSSPVSGEYVTITLYDTNNRESKELRLQTNEFGSVHGEFTLPTTGLNGEFTIEMDEDYDEDSKFWDNMYNFETVEHTIRVEEYKRPRFEITFNEITETYTLYDSITIKGKAKAFLGSSISDATVKYAVKREQDYSLPYRENQKEFTVTGNTATDQQGNFSIPFVAIPDPRSKAEDRYVYNYEIEVEITDHNGETRSQTQNINIGYHSLKATIRTDQNIVSDTKENALYVNITNLNNSPIAYSGTITIYKLKYPDRILRKRPWNTPDIQQIPYNTFIELFPNDIYSKKDKEQYDDSDIIATYTVNTSQDSKIKLGNINHWKGGKYIAKFYTKDTYGHNITAEQSFTVTNPDENYLSDQKIFEIHTDDGYLNTKNILKLELKTAATSLFVNITAFQKNNIIYEDIIEIINGKQVIPIPIHQKKDKIDVQVSFTKYNCIWTDNLTYHFPKHIENSDLNIELETFRNKLEPGKNETWKLKILTNNKTATSAEILASMYDMSLDTFIEHQWKNDIKITPYEPNYYNDLPSIDTQLSFQNNPIWIKNIKPNYYRPENTIYTNINSFGFNLVHTNRSHQKYVNTLNYHYNLEKPEKGKKLKAPGGTITGIITDDKGLPLPGVNVIIEGTDKGTNTDFDGAFSIEANKNDILIFSYIGFISYKAKIHNNQAAIVMRENTANLEEVVVTAMAIKTNKKSLSYSTSTITTESISSELDLILSGRVAGISIQEASLENIEIRGYASIKNKNKVLVIIDGVPVIKGIRSLNNLDIVNIQTLKGEAASALYGNRATNGIIILTTKKGLEELQKIVPRKNLQETAFFFPQLQTDKKGNISFNFTSPEALTRWKFQALAHDKQLNSALIQSEVITQKELSLIPNVPRFLREGDTITITTKIANLDIKKMKGLAALQLTDEISQTSLQSLLIDDPKGVQNFSIDPKGNTSISWKLHIPKKVKAIRYKIIAKAGKYSDGEESVLPVLSNRMLVTESMPIWVRPGKQKTVGFTKMKKQNSKTLENHQITLEYTSNPAWFAIKSLPYLMEFPYECAEQTFARYYSNEIAVHILNSNPKIKNVFDSWKTNGQLISNLEKNQELKNILIQETPWLRNAQSEKEQQSRLGELFDLAKIATKQENILNKLIKLQDASGGFPWFSGGNPNQFITRHIVSGLGHLRKLQIESEFVYTSNVAVKKAIAYLDKKYIENYNFQILKNGKYFFDNDDLHYFYARSFWLDTYPISKKIKNLYNKYIPKSSKNWLQKEIFDKAMLSLILFRNGDQTIAKDIITSLAENAVHSPENGMYWKENKAGWYWYQSPIETQALLIEAFSEITKNIKTVNELKIWLLKNKQIQSWDTTKATTEAIYALLLQGSDWLSVKETTDISFGEAFTPTDKLEINSTEAGRGYLKKQWNTDKITGKMADITILNKSKVPQYGGYYWQYFEDLDNITQPEEHKIQINKKLFIKHKSPEGTVLKPLTQQQLELGDLITVRIELNVKNNFEFVHMKDMRASGLEPVNVLSQYKYQDGLGYYESTKDASTNFFFDYLPKGVYVFEYDLRVNNKGDFSNGITSIQSMYAPEFSSHSEGVRIKIGK